MRDSLFTKISGASQRGLDAFAFFVADIQMGWGPFVAAYLTSVGWLQFDIGVILTIGTMAGFVLQVPLGRGCRLDPRQADPGGDSGGLHQRERTSTRRMAELRPGCGRQAPACCRKLPHRADNGRH